MLQKEGGEKERKKKGRQACLERKSAKQHTGEQGRAGSSSAETYRSAQPNLVRGKGKAGSGMLQCCWKVEMAACFSVCLGIQVGEVPR